MTHAPRTFGTLDVRGEGHGGGDVLRPADPAFRPVITGGAEVMEDIFKA